MARRTIRDKKLQRGIARERVFRLFELAEHAALAKEPALANRYAALARKIAMRFQYPIPGNLKSRFCRECGAYILPGASGRVRIRNARVISTCLECNTTSRHPFLKEKMERRRITASDNDKGSE